MTAIATAKSSHWAISSAGITFFMWEPSSVQLRVKAGLYPTRQNATPNLRWPLIARTGTYRLRLRLQLVNPGLPSNSPGQRSKGRSQMLTYVCKVGLFIAANRQECPVLDTVGRDVHWAEGCCAGYLR